MAAIYQWFEGVIEIQIWTTTLYPIEASEGIIFGVSVDSVVIRDIFEDEIEFTGAQFISGSKQVILLSMPEKQDEIEFTGPQFISGSIAQILITMPEKQD